MKETEKKKVVRVTEGNPEQEASQLPDGNVGKAERLKKPLIFALMGAVFLGCMYLIFSPSGENDNPLEKVGINDAVPQASDAGLQSDKQKAYEQELLEKKDQEKRKSLQTLSDYWSSDSTKQEIVQEETVKEQPNPENGGNALSSYRNVQSTLGSFYQKNDENDALRKELEEMKAELSQKKTLQDPMQNQLALMEKSYEMASKYFPGSRPAKNKDSVAATEKQPFVAFRQHRKNVVSALPRSAEGNLSAISPQPETRRVFSTAPQYQEPEVRNGIRACVHEIQIIAGEGNVRLRLLENAHAGNITIPQGAKLTASAKFQTGRLQLKISSIEHQGNIIPVEILVYDVDGQPGLYVPITPEAGAAGEMAANMSQTAGSNMMLTRSAGQQIAADLSRGVVQGVSGYFSKKVRVQKVTLKAGHQVFLVSKK
ncbi:conjugative transposon protein TraM [Flavobacterium sp.]|uniref:conjugative transposon protein TraM n=1 Tax=Flavobacterium sp. TaxID=239 RepID=UPI004034E40B